MRLVPRSLWFLLVLAPVVLAGCGNKHAGPVLFAETEGIYLDVAGLKYQVQISRQLNPQDTEDSYFVRGLPRASITPKETYFGVFLLVQNRTQVPRVSAREFEIEDTLGKTYEPLLINPQQNPFVYRQTTLAPGADYPLRESPSGEGPIGGGLLLFKLPLDAFYNRPLEFKIVSPRADNVVAVVDLDV